MEVERGVEKGGERDGIRRRGREGEGREGNIWGKRDREMGR